ncbi:MAG TPA: SusC/RagA family TonB-linked outer membrane protein, partial [Gemmatimonadaceae bacterium]|nr:SusC/RagA family TonB-linked outer membrane protein [Gemmatimonadaceae bacterium]
RIGAQTGPDGRYSFTVPAANARGQNVIMTARRIGYSSSSITVRLTGNAVVADFRLAPVATELTATVITGLGIERQKSRVGTAQQQVTSEELNQTKSINLLEQLGGKVSGVTITGSGTQGGSTNMIIRGANSITGTNQPLFVIDGIPMSNRGRGGDPNGGYDYGSAISDINPDDIASLSILKGPNAAALYGSRAANGVVVITTKKGPSTSGRVRTEISSTVTWDKPSILPDYQNLYGQGAQGEFEFVDGAGGGVNDFADQSYGPKLDGRLIDQFTGPNQPWVAHPDNVESFFNTGHTISNTIAFSGGTDRVTARMSLGRDHITGYIPNNTFSKTSGLLNGSVRVSDKLTTDATISYTHNTALNRPGVGYNNGILEQFVWFGRQVDMNALRAYSKGGASNGGPDNREFNWNYNFHNNPFWMMYENPLQDTRDRILGSVSATYRLLPGVSATARTGTDIFRFNVDQRFAPQNIQGNAIDPNFFGGFTFLNDYSRQVTSDVSVTAARELSRNFSVNATLGAGRHQEQLNTTSTVTTGLSVAGIYNVTNAAVTPTLGQFDSRRQVNGVYGDLAVTAFNWLTVEATGRNDWSSTLPEGKNSYFYPSLSASAVLTEAIPSLSNRFLSYAKVRASTARVGADAGPYQLRTTYGGLANKFAGLPQFSLQNFIANPELLPEQTKAVEAGLELSMLDGRATLDLSWYDKATRNQIFTIPVSPTSGFQSKAVNAGKISNKGIDFLLGITPLRNSNGLEWTSTFNYSRNKSMVDKLAPGITTFVIGSSWYTNIEAREGEPYGSIFGYAFDRDSATGKIYTDGGITVLGGRKVLGNIQPDWTGGWNNSFKFRNFSLNALIDMRRGGNIVSITNFFGEYSGVLKSSLKGREEDWNKPGLVVDGIDINTGKPNTERVTAEQYFQNIFPVMEPYVYDASWTKLRELRFGFELPTRWASRFGARAVNVSLTGRNLFTWTDVPNIDPEFSYSIGNFQGVEFAALPNARSWGLSFRITP